MLFSNLFDYFFQKKEQAVDKNNKNNTTDIDLLISLNKNMEIDISMFMNDDLTDKKLMDIAYLYAKFIDEISSDYLKKQIIDVLTNQIKCKENASLIETIIIFLDRLNIPKSTSATDQIFIKPSQVFSKYYDRL